MSALKYFDPVSNTWQYVGYGAKGDTGASGPQGLSGVVNVNSGELTNSGSSTSAQLGLASAGTAGTYTKVTTDSKGRVSSGTTLSAGDIPNIAQSQVTNLSTTFSAKQSKASLASFVSQAVNYKTVPAANNTNITTAFSNTTTYTANQIIPTASASTIAPYFFGVKQAYVTASGNLTGSGSTTTDTFIRNIVACGTSGNSSASTITDTFNGATATVGMFTTQFWVEFDYYGSGFDVKYLMLGGLATDRVSQLQVWVDGVPVTAATETTSSGIGAFNRTKFYQVRFSTAAQRRIRIFCCDLFWGGIYTSSTTYDTVTPVQKKALKVALLGDSWTAGRQNTTGSPSTGVGNNYTYSVQLGELLNAEVFNCGQGATGYVWNGSSIGTSTSPNFKDNYADSVRLSNLASVSPDVVIILGSVNDDHTGLTTTDVTTNANLVYSTLTSSLPNTPIIVAGVQPTTSSNASTNRTNINSAVIAAATAAIGSTNVVGVIDAYGTELWINGNTTIGSATPDGNSSYYVLDDATHLTVNGNLYWTRRTVARLLDYLKTYVNS
jgi:hypothetical protein